MSRRLAGLVIPAFTTRRDADLGIGDTRALIEWIALAADHAVGLLQLLPINEVGSDDSPYDALSSVALEPLYLAMEEVPGIDPSEVAAATAEVSPGPVDYDEVRRRKRRLLDSAWKRWPQAEPGLHHEFDRFRRAEAAWLDDYANFRTLVEVFGSAIWDEWPDEVHDPTEARACAAEHSDLTEFFAWVQWLCFGQWLAVRRFADERGVQLMGDIPIGIGRYSADVFFQRDDFDLEWCGGAPPETMFKHDEFIRRWGQNWGIPLYDWAKMRSEDYPWWRRRIQKLTDIFHVFRIDHILGLYRIYAFPWLPQFNEQFLALTGAEAAERTGGVLPRWVPRPDDLETNRDANRADGDHRLKMVIDAAGGAQVVGEDLGVVPDYVRPHMTSLDVAGFRIPHWDADDDGKVISPDEIDECTFATYATHDHDPLASLWLDLAERSTNVTDTDDAIEAAELWQRLAAFGDIEPNGPFGDQERWALIDALMASRSRYAAVMITDLFGLEDRINQPGTVGSHNWAFRLSETAADSRRRPEWRRLAVSIKSSDREADR
ncbi:MAG: 4-alpha-glucanotransferase [Actinomycetia bacterium]|nr:4-alpha-glucanotransferase [Actinomycetes bacterium]MCP4959997.1 4-alpha-glucanotransferase [Actinomycetes bacterium]